MPTSCSKTSTGKRFDDVTESSGTGHLQKGHGVSFADWDCDGDLDLFVELGGATPGDQSYNALFQNPAAGTSLAQGQARRHQDEPRGPWCQDPRRSRSVRRRRAIYRTVGNNSSFGGNSLVEMIGLGDAMRVDALTISWPASKTTQTFRDLARRPDDRNHRGLKSPSKRCARLRWHRRIDDSRRRPAFLPCYRAGPSPSIHSSVVLTGRFKRSSTFPDGQRISRRSTAVAAPRPKWTRRSLEER